MQQPFDEGQQTNDNSTNTKVTVSGSDPTINVSKPNPPESWQALYARVFIPAFFSLLVMLTAIYKIVTNEQETPELRTTWWTILASQAAAWLPSPLKQTKDN